MTALQYAENLMREAYSITEASHGPAHPETVKSLSALGTCEITLNPKSRLRAQGPGGGAAAGLKP